MIIQGRINFKQVGVLLDTGSSVNIIPKNIISQIKGYHNVEYIKTKIATINGEIEVLDESRSFFRVHTGYFSNIPKCIKAEFIASWGCSQSSVVSSSQR
ncbi:hypothetical protein TNCV_2383821 [Trichonephila clavipes]|nr:hypothetical protein TNCV_2383821 [Trichonephila clavipes]